MKKITVLILSLVLFFTACFALSSCRRGEEPDSPDGPSEDTSLVYLVRDGVTDYKIVYSSADTSGGTKAYRLNQLIGSSVGGVTLTTVTDSETESSKELIIGDTCRQLSSEIKARATDGAAQTDHVWGFYYKEGQLAFYYNTDVAFERGCEEFAAKFLKDSGLVVPTDTLSFGKLTAAEYEKELEDKAAEEKAEAEAKKQAELDERLTAVKAAMAAATFTDASFGADGNWQTTYAMPEGVYSTDVKLVNEHPRLFVTKADVKNLRATLEKDIYKNLSASFWALADSKNFTGVFPETTHDDGETSRYSELILQQIEARAMAYLVTGHKAYGYEAILGIKNAMLSLKFTSNIHLDVYHGPSHVMLMLAKVYDWCYDLLTEEDKKQLISGCVYLLITAQHFTDDDFVLEKNKPSKKGTLHTNKQPYGLELGLRFPPSGASYGGHATGPQFLRDHIAVTVAFADEVPSWWQYVGGKFYTEYLPAQKEFYKNGYVPSGTANYAPAKIICSAFAAYALKTGTGTNPYGDTLGKCSAFLLSHLLPNGRFFPTGDGSRSTTGVAMDHEFFFLLAGLYNDTFALEAAKKYSKDFSSYSKEDNDVSMFPVYPGLVTAICTVCDDPDGNYPEDIPLYNYTPYPAGQMTVRNSWRADSAIVMMKIFERTNAMHDNFDAGSFQIYYKGLLACTSGAYNWGSNEHFYYMQCTVSNNGLLVYNPALKDNYGGWYSGSQIRLDGADDFEDWVGGAYDIGKVTGVANGYASDGKTPTFAYISGDITNAYDDCTVDYVGRRMLTVYTNDADIPMVFFVYDSISSTDADFKKSFLLHCVKEPEISGTATNNSFTVSPNADGQMQATVTEGDGKLVLTNVSGGDLMHKIGGEGFAYWIGNENEFDGTAASGFNGVDPGRTDSSNKIWGRIEVTARGETTTDMLNTVYVTGAKSTAALASLGIETEKVVGAVMGKIAAVFVKDSERATSTIEFCASGEGNIDYYVSGLYAGTWDVYVNGSKVKTVKSSEDAGFIRFNAPAGDVRLVPGDDILKEGHSFVVFNANGGKMPEEYPKTYEEGVGLSLTGIAPTRANYKFLGWYLDSKLTQPIEEIPNVMTGTVKLYAKWTYSFIDVDFGKVTVNASDGNTTTDGTGLVYYTTNKPGASFITKTDGDGKSYLEWDSGNAQVDSILRNKEGSDNLSNMLDGNATVSYEFDIAGIEGSKAPPARLQILTSSSAGEGSGDFTVFEIKENGNVLLGRDATKVIGNVFDGVKIRIAVDFKNSKLTAYLEDGGTVELEIALPDKVSSQGFSSIDEWRKAKIKTFTLYFRCSKTNTAHCKLRINRISCTNGDIFG